MHPYEMAATLKQRHKEDSIKLRYGSLYTVIDSARGPAFHLRPARRRAPASARSEPRTSSPDAGYDELRSWMHDLLRTPVNEYPQFTAGLSLLPVLPPEEAVALLRERAIHLSAEAARLESHLAELAHQEVPLPPHEMPPALVGKKFPPLFVVEAEYKLGADPRRARLRDRARAPRRPSRTSDPVLAKGDTC